VTASGGGTGALTWAAPSCTLNAVNGTTQELQRNGGGTCTLTVDRAASSGYSASRVVKTFTWSNN
jgi:hypothetical protein